MTDQIFRGSVGQAAGRDIINIILQIREGAEMADKDELIRRQAMLLKQYRRIPWLHFTSPGLAVLMFFLLTFFLILIVAPGLLFTSTTLIAVAGIVAIPLPLYFHLRRQRELIWARQHCAQLIGEIDNLLIVLR